MLPYSSNSRPTGRSSGLSLRADVRLAALSRSNAEAMFRWMGDPDVAGHIGLRKDASLEGTLTWIDRALGDPTFCCFAILLNEQHVGNVILDRIDSYIESARLSVYIGEAFARRCGVGTTAMYLALKHAFKDLSLHKVWLTVHGKNYRAIQSYTNLGFVIEGVLRDEFRLNGVLLPAFYMGLLRHEFASLPPLTIDSERE